MGTRGAGAGRGTAGMVVAGAGECGARAALALREEGYDGPVTLIGAETHPPYERPPLSKEAMCGSDAPAPRTIATAETLARNAIRFIAGTPAAGIDRAGKRVLLADGDCVPYHKLLIATGSMPRLLPTVAPSARIACLRSFDDALSIRAHLRAGARIAIVGGGFIGLELAASARTLGAEVIVVEAQPRILMRGVPGEIAGVLGRAHDERGVEIVCGARIEKVREDGEAVRIDLACGRTLEADLVVVGVGAVPATALAEAAGLAVDNGVAVDERLRSSDPDIFAAGDCCSFPLAIYGGRRVRLEAWRNAQEQGALAARNMLGAEEGHAAVPWFWSDQYGMSLHIAGLVDEGRATVRRVLGEGAIILFHLAGDGRLVAASGIGPGNAVAKDVRLAEIMIGRGARPDPADLAQPQVRLKSLLPA